VANQLINFIFEESDVRGAIVHLDEAFEQLLSGHQYPEGYQALMAQFVAANVLLTSKLKFEGVISLQARGASEALTLTLSECNDKLEFRGIMRGSLEEPVLSFQELFADGILALTIEPAQGTRYQGMVPLEKDNLAACIQDYFERSEQIPTWLYLLPSSQGVRGMMLQALPSQLTDAEQREEDWSRLVQLAQTIKPEEILSLDAEQMLYRLYHEEPVRLFDAQEVAFKCSCSQERMERALISLGREELEGILAEDGKIETQCEFCNHEYKFTAGEIQHLLQAGSAQ